MKVKLKLLSVFAFIFAMVNLMPVFAVNAEVEIPEILADDEVSLVPADFMGFNELIVPIETDLSELVNTKKDELFNSLGSKESLNSILDGLFLSEDSFSQIIELTDVTIDDTVSPRVVTATYKTINVLAKNTITNISVDVQAPKVGNTIEGMETIPVITVPENANYKLGWTYYISGYPSELATYDKPFVGTIEKDEDYYIEIGLIPASEDYVFDINNFELTVNGKTDNYELCDYNFSGQLMFYVKLKSVDDVTKYTVDFNTNGGSSISSIEVEEGNKITEPTKPVRDGYTFIGWYTDAKLSNKFDFNSTIDSDTELYAKWEETKYTVTFNTNGGTNFENVQVKKGQSLGYLLPGYVEKEDYIFAGWYTDSDFKNEFSNNTTINSDITLYAKYDKDERIKITEINLTVAAPVAGEKVVVEEKQLEDEYGTWYENVPNIEPIVTENGEGYKNYYSTWVLGTCSEEDYDSCYIWFEDTFEEGKAYYASISLEAEEGYRFSKDVLDNVKINGEKPAEVFAVYDGVYTRFIAKVKATTSYEILNGANQTVNTNDILSFRANIEYSDFLATGKVYVDDVFVDASNYTSKEGSTIITFTDAFKNSLSTGKHTFKITVANGETGTDFTIVKYSINPNTGDSLTTIMTILVLSIIGLCGTVAYARKEN